MGRELTVTRIFMIGIWSVTAASEGGVEGTRCTAVARHWTEADSARHAELGFDQGWGACADHLKMLAESRQATGED